MISGLGGAVWVIFLAVGAWMLWRKKAPKTTTFFFLIAGLGLGGVLGTLLGNIIRAVLGLLSTLLGRLLGVPPTAITIAIALFLVLELVFTGLWFKKAKPHRWHPFLALAMSTIAVAAGLPIVVDGLSYLDQMASSVGAYFG